MANNRRRSSSHLDKEDIENLNKTYDLLKKSRMNNVDEIVEILRDAEVYDGSPAQEARLRSYFDDVPDKNNITREKFREVIERAALDTELTAPDPNQPTRPPQQPGPPQQGYPQQIGPPQQGYPQQFGPPQQGYPQQLGPPQQGYPQQLGPPQQGYPQQLGPPQQGYPQQVGPSQQGGPQQEHSEGRDKKCCDIL